MYIKGLSQKPVRIKMKMKKVVLLTSLLCVLITAIIGLFSGTFPATSSMLWSVEWDGKDSIEEDAQWVPETVWTVFLKVKVLPI